MSSHNVPYPYPHRRTPVPRKHLNPWVLRFLMLFIAGALLLFFVLMIMVAGYEFLHQDEIFPGVSTVMGLDLAGMTRQEAYAALDENFTYDDAATFTFRYSDQSWEFTAAELGVQMDVDATVDAAYHAGRSGDRLDNLVDQYDIWTSGYAVALVIVYNQGDAERLLTEIAATYVNRAVIDATLTIRDGQAVPAASQIGRTVDVAATLSVLRHEVLALSAHSTINLVVNETPPAVWDTTAAAEQINVMLSAPVEFYMDPADGIAEPWISQVSSLEEMLALVPTQNDDGTVEYEVTLSLDQTRAFLESLAPDLTSYPVNARFIFDDETEQLEVLEPSSPGRALDVETTVAQFEAAIYATNPADRRVQLVFYDVPPQIPDTATGLQLGITEKVVQKTTYFYGSTAARRVNIQVATANFHGLVIPPGGVFSFNEWLGDVSTASGYEQGLIIVGNQTITGVGGGVCQVATTAFQVAFYGGYPIMERIEHAYRVAYYEEGEGAGMDATVYSPIVDFRFVNDTPYHLLIETYYNAANSTLTWKFYSTSLGRRVEKDGPYIRNQTPAPPAIYRANAELSPGQIRHVDYATSGADVFVYRTVYEGDRVIIDREEFHSRYVPWADQYEVAPGDPRINN
ncbi:MAG: VanW family protein [Anaerolineae bacterium]|nr:VanW family protein [Anaerolineae bacterium]